MPIQVVSPGPKALPTTPVGHGMNQTPVNKFDYVTRLVTQHETNLGLQNIQVAELTRKTAELELKTNTELSLLAHYRDRNILAELDSLKRDVDHHARRVDQIQDAHGSDARALQLGLLAAEVSKLREEVVELRQANHELSARLDARTAAGVAGLKAELAAMLQEQVKALAAELQSEVGAVRSESSAAASSAEAASLTANSLAQKLRSHMQTCATGNGGLASQVETLSSAINGLSSNVEHMEGDSKKVKKHVVKLERQVEALSALGSVALNADKALGEMRRSADEAHEHARRLRTQTEECMAEVRSLVARVREAEAAGADGEAQLRADLTSLAEAVGSALQHVSEASRRQAQAQPPSLLQALLAPGPGPPVMMPSMAAARMALHGGYAPLMPAGAPPGVQGWGQPGSAQGQGPDPLETARGEYDRFLQGLRSHGAGHRRSSRSARAAQADGQTAGSRG